LRIVAAVVARRARGEADPRAALAVAVTTLTDAT